VGYIYQSRTAGASPTPAVPEQVLVSLEEIAESGKEGLLALAVGAGLQVMSAMMDADVMALAGPKGKHLPERVAVPSQQRGRGGHPGRASHWRAPAAGTRRGRLGRGAPAVL